MQPRGAPAYSPHRQAVNAWAREILLYNFSNPGFSEETGHATQLLWKASTQLVRARPSRWLAFSLGSPFAFLFARLLFSCLRCADLSLSCQGCGLATGCTTPGTLDALVVCRYAPPGNVIGEFADNVFPATTPGGTL